MKLWDLGNFLQQHLLIRKVTREFLSRKYYWPAEGGAVGNQFSSWKTKMERKHLAAVAVVGVSVSVLALYWCMYLSNILWIQ